MSNHQIYGWLTKTMKLSCFSVKAIPFPACSSGTQLRQRQTQQRGYSSTDHVCAFVKAYIVKKY